MGCGTSSPGTVVTSQQTSGTANYATMQTVVHHPGQYPQQVRYPQQPLGPPPVYYNQQRYPVQQMGYRPQFIAPNTTVVQQPQTVVYQDRGSDLLVGMAAGAVMSNAFYGPHYYHGHDTHIHVHDHDHFHDSGGFDSGGGDFGGGDFDGGGGCDGGD